MTLRFCLFAFWLPLAAPVHGSEIAAHLVVQNSPLAAFRYNDGKLLWGDLRAGDALRLVREPDNPYDANAVRVEWRGHKLGYVPRHENSDLARQLDGGAAIEARITELVKRRNGRHLISYDILVPLRTTHDAQGGGK